MQYPVVSVDSHMPIVSPFSGAQFGKLKVVLSMGSQAQVGVKLCVGMYLLFNSCIYYSFHVFIIQFNIGIRQLWKGLELK